MTGILTVADAMLERLRTVDNLIVFDSHVPELTADMRDEKNRAKPYVVLYPAAGRATATRMCATPADLATGGQVTCAAGTPDGARWAVDKVRGVLTGWRPFPNDRASSRLTEVGGDTDPIRLDKDVPSDWRWFAPLLYRLDTSN